MTSPVTPSGINPNPFFGSQSVTPISQTFIATNTDSFYEINHNQDLLKIYVPFI